VSRRRATRRPAGRGGRAGGAPAFGRALALGGLALALGALALAPGGLLGAGCADPAGRAAGAAAGPALAPAVARAGAAAGGPLLGATAPAALVGPFAPATDAAAGALLGRLTRRVGAREAVRWRCRMDPYVALTHPLLVGTALRGVGVDEGTTRTVTGLLGAVDRGAVGDLSRELCELVLGGSADGPGRPRLARLHDALRRLGVTTGALDPLVARLVDLAATGREPTALDAAGATTDVLRALDVPAGTAAAAGTAVGLGLWLLGSDEPKAGPDAGAAAPPPSP
jgi:hypothetical protein